MGIPPTPQGKTSSNPKKEAMGSWPPPVDDEFIGSQESEYDGYSPPSKRICYNAVNGNTNQNNCAWSHDTDWLQWDKDEVAERLNQAGLMDVAAVFKKECIVGEILPRIKDKHLDEMGIRPLGNKLRVQKFIEDVTRQTLQKDLRNKELLNTQGIGTLVHTRLVMPPSGIGTVHTRLVVPPSGIGTLEHTRLVMPPSCIGTLEHTKLVVPPSGIGTLEHTKLVVPPSGIGTLVHTRLVMPPSGIGTFVHTRLVMPLSGIGTFVHTRLVMPPSGIGTLEHTRYRNSCTHKVSYASLRYRNICTHKVSYASLRYRNSCTHKVFNDPIHGHIELHPLCVKIIDTPEFQRLRFLKQLGTCYFGMSFSGKIGARVTGHFHISLMENLFPLSYRIQNGSLEPEFDKYGLTEQDRVFIKEQIAGPSKPDQENWTLEGRPKDKSFLYEVVANKRNGIDVDKWDYFARDCHMLGIRNNFDHDRCIHFSRVLLEVGNLYDMFHTRQTLHRRAYQHKTTNIIEKMVTEALVKANDHIKFTGEDGKKLKMSESIHDMKAFSQMTDHVFNLILNSTEADLRESREILKKVLRRELYKCVGQTQTKDKILKELVNLDYGMKEKNPIDSVRFYSKDRPDVAVQIRKEQESSFIPGHFKEQQIRIYSKQVDPRSLEMVRKAFNSWCNDKNFPAPKGGDENSLELTPVEKGKASNSSNDTEGSDGHHRGESAKVTVNTKQSDSHRKSGNVSKNCLLFMFVRDVEIC
ncbi:SAMH1-like protein [Mya arenaria]|uniref:SAMH1-like protein n=1 Tax=Mya arenaria TaxID=6604 RepID=A0ABY7EP09_MYAAR|nr:SAMH1-like protein [Mya arenaria]